MARHASVRVARLALLGLLILVALPAPIEADSAPPPRRVHVVARGETLEEIAARYGVTVDAIIEANGLEGAEATPGLRLRIPPPGRPTPKKEVAPPDPPPAPPKPRTKAPEKKKTKATTKTHTVRRGETLSGIASKYGTSVNTLKDLNELSGSRIFAGQVLRVSESEAAKPSDEPVLSYVVQRGDTLSEIADRFDVSLSYIRKLNDLSSTRIMPGQRLRLRPTERDQSVHVVRRGDTLSEIASKYGMTTREVRDINGIEGSRIMEGQVLRLTRPSVTKHLVQRGDALWEIAQAYGVSVSDLKRMNGLRSNRIYPGQELTLIASDERPAPKSDYVVRRGDSLIEIAQLHQMTLSELKRLNDLRGNTIHPGQRLHVRPLLGGSTIPLLDSVHDIDWSLLASSVPGLTRIAAENGPYFGLRPRAGKQSSRRYIEESRLTPPTAYKRAKALLDTFEKRVAGMGRLSRKLEGWHLVLDPGHGGIDPGAIVKTSDGRGDDVYVVEDEYVYDITLRIYVLLRLHGAKVTLTLLSPNHLIRQTEPATRTFVHERNEVFNLASKNRRNTASAWPKGGQAGLTARVQVAKEAFKNVPQKRRIFLSIHADNSPGAPAVPTVLYYANSRRTDSKSRKFAQTMLPALGAGAQMRGQRLEVLRANPAEVKALVEVRNTAYPDHAWALRFEEMRQRDAEKVVKGVLDYVSSRR